MREQPTNGTDHGVAADTIYCQNFEAHPDKEPEMQAGPYDGVMCPECGRMAGGDLSIPYADQEGGKYDTPIEQEEQ